MEVVVPHQEERKEQPGFNDKPIGSVDEDVPNEAEQGGIDVDSEKGKGEGHDGQQTSSGIPISQPSAASIPATATGRARALAQELRLADGHKEAMDAVMQLAQAASQQPPYGSEGEDERQSHHEGDHASTAEAQEGDALSQKKRRMSSTGRAQTQGGKHARAEDADGASSSAPSTSQATAAGLPGFNPPFQWSNNEGLAKFLSTMPGLTESSAGQSQEPEESATGQQEADSSKHSPSAGLSSQHDGGADGSAEAAEAEENAVLLARNGRPLNTTKRAAQNRAAQRAFRARRDEYVRTVEEKAKQLDEAMSASQTYKHRYEEALRTIESLRSDNQSLRMAISALGGQAPPPPPAAAGVEETESTAEADKQTRITADEPEASSSTTGKTHEQDVPEKRQQTAIDASTSKRSDLSGLSAVAAAAEAAAAASSAPSSSDSQAGRDTHSDVSRPKA